MLVNASLLLLAGHETTINLLCNGTLSLLRHPDQWALLKQDPAGRARLATEECLRYALSLPTSVVITGCDTVPILEQALRAWRNFTPMTADEMCALRARTAPRNPQGTLEGYKTTGRFDGTNNNPHWLTTASVTA